MDQITNSDYFYFGKCPARGDFVRSSGQHAMIGVLDEWVTKALEIHAEGTNSGNNHADNYLDYDQMAGLSFVFCNPKMPVALTGYLSASHDASKRRFPLITGYRLQLKQPERFIENAPILLDSLWQNSRHKNEQVAVSTDAQEVMQLLDQPAIFSWDAAAKYQVYISHNTVDQAAKSLQQQQYQFAQSLIALGLLLQPIVSQGVKKLNKVLLLPLTTEPKTSLMATFWLELISVFIKRQNIELSVAVWNTPQPVLLVGFQGADIVGLSQMMQNDMQSDHWVHVAEASWVDSYLENDAGLATFEQVLCDPQITMYEAIQLFKQIFI